MSGLKIGCPCCGGLKSIWQKRYEGMKTQCHEALKAMVAAEAERDALQAKVREFETWLELATDGEVASSLSEDAFNYALNALFAYRSLFGLEAGDE